jgi:acyl dehydratase
MAGKCLAPSGSQSATEYRFDDIDEGDRASYRYTITPEVHDALVTVFGDRSPLHVDEEYARVSGFGGRVMHGATFHGFLSHFVGMHFPGRRSLLLSANLNYHRPSYLGDQVELLSTVKQKITTNRVIVLNIEFVNTESHERVVSGRAQVALRDE